MCFDLVKLCLTFKPVKLNAESMNAKIQKSHAVSHAVSKEARIRSELKSLCRNKNIFILLS